MRDHILNNESVDTLLSLLESNGIIPYFNDLESDTESSIKEFSNYSLDFLYTEQDILFKPEELYHLLKNNILKDYDTDSFSDICMNIHCRFLLSV